MCTTYTFSSNCNVSYFHSSSCNVSCFQLILPPPRPRARACRFWTTRPPCPPRSWRLTSRANTRPRSTSGRSPSMKSKMLSLYYALLMFLTYLAFERKKLLHSSSFREIRSKSHEETRQFQENFEVRWFLFPYFFIDLQFLMTKHLHQLCRCTCKHWSLNVSTRTSSLRFSLKKVKSMSIRSVIYLVFQRSRWYFKTKN